MSLPTPKIIAGLLAALVAIAAVVGAAIILWPSEDEAPPLRDVDPDTDLIPPMDAPDAWADLDSSYELNLLLEDMPHFSYDGTPILRGLGIEGTSPEWSVYDVDGWTVASGVLGIDGVSAHTAIWTAPGFPMAIIDMDVEIYAERAGDEVTAMTFIKSDDAEFLTSSLEHRSDTRDAGGEELLAARFATSGPVVQLSSSDGAAGRLVEGPDGHIAIQWTLWPGDETVSGCLEEDARAHASLRLIVHFGDHPLVAPLPVPADATALGTPIFVDATATTGDPWVDGTARDAEDLALRLRSLAFGHSDREDPRYGNGGLLATDMGAVFAIPPTWWDEEPIRALRRSLEGTAIEIIPETDLDIGERHTTGALMTDGGDCSIFTDAAAPNRFELIPVTTNSSNYPFHNGLSSPLPPVIDVGKSPRHRDSVLARQFETGRTESLLSAGSYRALVIPVVATRNPLVDVFENNILSPERHGQWTLHEDLTREFVRRELNDASLSLQTLSFRDLLDHRHRHRRALPYFKPDGTLNLATPENDAPYHLYALGRASELHTATERRSSQLATWLHDPHTPATVDTPPKAIDIQVE